MTDLAPLRAALKWWPLSESDMYDDGYGRAACADIASLYNAAPTLLDEVERLRGLLGAMVWTDVHVCHGHPCARCLVLADARTMLEAKK